MKKIDFEDILWYKQYSITSLSTYTLGGMAEMDNQQSKRQLVTLLFDLLWIAKKLEETDVDL